jgi:DNA-binding response OmpR family regulator
MKIFIIEDEKELDQSIADYLRVENYHCEFATTFSEALAKTNDTYRINFLQTGLFFL